MDIFACRKEEVIHIMKKFITMVQTQFNKSIRIVRSNNGTMFVCLKNYFEEKVILHQKTIVGTQQQNGRVERKHRHILNIARAYASKQIYGLNFRENVH